MKILLTTLNSKFIHTNLAIRYLQNTLPKGEVEIAEFTINQPKEYVYRKILEKEPDILGWSVYIWNHKETIEICQMIKQVCPNTKIILGGPEVSYDSVKLMEKYPFIDFIISHEGEDTFPELVESIKGNLPYKDILGITYRDQSQVIENRNRPLVKNLNLIPFPYNTEEDFTNKIIYYESSRGCPFHCEFCLSSTIQGLRFLSMDRIKEDLGKLIQLPIGQIKFVDRTFNAREEDAMEIMNFLIKHAPKHMNFHFEVTAHLVSEKMLDFLKKAPKGMFQLEVGIQSTHNPTVQRIGRTTDFERLEEVVTKIKSYGNIHQHVDLILGLPYEGLEEFRESFNNTFRLGAEKIQVGFLKCLKGSGLRRDAKELGLIFDPNPPYEILSTPWMDAQTLIKLKYFEDVIEKFLNEEYFQLSNQFVMKESGMDPFTYFFILSEFWEKKGFGDRAIGRRELYQILYEFGVSIDINVEKLLEYLMLDYGRTQGKLLKLDGLEEKTFILEKTLWHDLYRDMMEDGITIDEEEDRVKELVKRSIVLETPVVRPGKITLFYTPRGEHTKEFIWNKKGEQYG
ncbi:MAG: DUF4080 domain-containing protein [Tissierellia bacterium]|nr:DUF4080 domain-containing protein [Tissierellia bacterium]